MARQGKLHRLRLLIRRRGAAGLSLRGNMGEYLVAVDVIDTRPRRRQLRRFARADRMRQSGPGLRLHPKINHEENIKTK